MHAILGRQWLLRKRVPLFPHLVTVKKISQMKFLMSFVTVVQRLVKPGNVIKQWLGSKWIKSPPISNDRIQELIARVPSDFLGIVCDPTNLITPETASKQVEIVAEAFEKFGERIVRLHLKDYVIEEDRIVSVPLGEGIIPYQAHFTNR